MNPRDKDFVTRFQLSQIVTEDPYNEDFYCQVYKLLNSNANENNISSIAQKYLEQSGHRLGGRSKRADVALQRMQQQVSKAVTVAKERGKRTGVFSKEGALGKVSFGTGRQPRKQLVLSSNENPEEGEAEGETGDDGEEIEQDEEVSNEQDNKTTSKSGSDELKNLIQKKSTTTGTDTTTTSSSSSQQEQDNEITLPKEYIFSKSSRSFQLSIIEDIYSQVLKLESLERENQEINSNDLWKCLHINDKIQTSEGEINPFISVLSFDKSMKVFNRLFHFLTNEQKFKIVELIFINLQKLDIVLKGSYKNYINENYDIPKKYLNKIELFQMTIMKTLVLYISESKFLNVLSLLNSVIINNNILFLSTTKIGLSLITILVSRLELIKQELNKNLSAHDLSSWLLIYDKLFQGLEGRLNQIFPPYLSCDENKSVINQLSIDDDDSYIWQFLASLSLAGLLNHQRIIVDEIRNEIFGVMNKAKISKQNNDINNYNKLLNNLNLFLNVMGLKANENDIGELS
ncbi:unnamed protein product [[Candida] boidinii]|uniref:Unnamed protein product n=1 Tax=Candida boidinii TaxID=5477 RepID=A0ACB5TGH9_CANBO|nr:unnamed protein product [[Candida] boidinii]